MPILKSHKTSKAHLRSLHVSDRLYCVAIMLLLYLHLFSFQGGQLISCCTVLSGRHDNKT